MAWFGRKRHSRIGTLIGAGTHIRGDLVFEGGLHLDGVVEGQVVGGDAPDSILMVSERGRILGDVKVTNLILDGTVLGDVHASGRVELAPRARVTGTLYYRYLEMAMGAEVNGRLVHQDEIGDELEDEADGEDGDDRPEQGAADGHT